MCGAAGYAVLLAGVGRAEADAVAARLTTLLGVPVRVADTLPPAGGHPTSEAA